MIEYALGFAWKLVDGSSFRPELWNALLLSGMAVMFWRRGMLSWSHLWLALVTYGSLMAGYSHLFFDGFTDWTMVFRFSLYALIASAPLVWFEDVSWRTVANYVALCAVAGATYPIFHAFHMVGFEFFVCDGLGLDGFDSYARGMTGGAVIGGLAAFGRGRA